MDFNKYIFIMARCYNTVPDLPEATGDWVGCTCNLYWFYYWFQGIQI